MPARDWRDWQDAEYSRIYHTVVDDPKFEHVFDDDRRFAAYVRLLMAAESAYPSPAPLPRWLADDVLEHLTETRILEVVRRTSYRIVGLQAEREGRATGRQVGGKARIVNAERDALGRLLPAREPSSNGSSKDPADDPATPSNTQQQTSADASNILLDYPAEPAKTSRDSAKPRREEDSLRARGRAKRADVQALLDRGWPKVSRAQRKVLDEVLTRHDVTGPEFAAEVIRSTPPNVDPLAAVMTADRLWQEGEKRRAAVEEKAWAETKGDPRGPTKLGETLRKVDAALPDWAAPAEAKR